MSFDDYNASSSGDPNIIKTDHFHVTQFEPDPEIYNLASGMEIFGFPYKNYYSKQSDITNATLIVSQESTTTWNNRVSLFLSEFRQDDDSRFGPSSSRSVNNMQEYFRIRNSKYLEPARELLNEFCEGNRSDEMKKVRKSCSEWEDENFVRKQHFYSLDLLELQKRKSRLLQMLEEVERRYKSYCNQMKSVVSSFELVAGNGAARVYSSMASQAMSRHFRCLKDGILTQIKATKTAMGDKDTAAPGTTKGETPRLRLLDQTLRQQRAFLLETHPWRPHRGLPEKSVAVLRAWLFEHFLHPYPSDVDKHILARQTGLSRSQVSNWFINARVRLWKPMVEEMYLEDLKEDDGPAAANLSGSNDQQNQNPTHEDKKPTHDQLTRTDSECLSSIKSTLENDPNFGGDKFGPTQFDFSSYNHHSGPAAAAASYLNENTAHHNYGGVSLTLGLQQHGGSGGGVSQSSVFYTILDSENQNLPYKNLIGSQLLHDLVG